MAVPTAITDLSATAASNSPAGSDAVFTDLDNFLRAIQAFIRQGDTRAADVASASTADLGAAVGRFVNITGTTTITSFGTVAAGIWRVVTFAGALTLTHNATSLILPGGANITTAAGDSLIAESLGSGNWKVHVFMPGAGYTTKTYVDSGLSGKSDTGHTHAWSAILYKGLAEGSVADDPNTTQLHQIVTNHANSPDSTYYWHITTTFYSTLTGSLAQIAVQYNAGATVYARSYDSGTWQPWVRCDLGEGLTRSIGATGYAKVPGTGGLLVQWGSISHGGGGNVAVSFPIAFPNAAVAVVPNSVYNGSANNQSAHSKSASGFTCYWTGSATITIDYIAIGY